MHSGMYLQSLLEEVNICGACDLLQLVEQRLLVLAQGLKERGGQVIQRFPTHTTSIKEPTRATFADAEHSCAPAGLWLWDGALEQLHSSKTLPS